MDKMSGMCRTRYCGVSPLDLENGTINVTLCSKPHKGTWTYEVILSNNNCDSTSTVYLIPYLVIDHSINFEFVYSIPCGEQSRLSFSATIDDTNFGESISIYVRTSDSINIRVKEISHNLKLKWNAIDNHILPTSICYPINEICVMNGIFPFCSNINPSIHPTFNGRISNVKSKTMVNVNFPINGIKNALTYHYHIKKNNTKEFTFIMGIGEVVQSLDLMLCASNPIDIDIESELE